MAVKKYKTITLLTAALAAIFFGYSLSVIWSQSFIAIDGQRYFNFADDGLITLRYAWNLAHGQGLVWNAGEHVEGITNLLWALHASALSLVLSKRYLPLAMICLGLVYLMFTALAFRLILRRCLNQETPNSSHPILEMIAFLLPLSYFPLVSWTLSGMELPLESALVACAILLILSTERKVPAYLGPTILGLAFLTRPDCIVPSAAVFFYRLYIALSQRRSLTLLLKEWLPMLTIVASASLFRYVYYGSLTPNTFLLKMGGMSFWERLQLNGLPYTLGFINETLVLWVLLIFSLVLRPTLEKLLFSALPASMVVYSLSTGGDAFVGWRFLAPFVPFAFLALLLDFPTLDRMLREHFAGRPDARIKYFGTVIFAGVCFFTLARPPYDRYVEFASSPPAKADIANVNTAIFLNRILPANASVGVFFAGSIPFYTKFYAVDFLGKSDPHIASSLPDKSGAIAFGLGKSAPGHNKYDLVYSILIKRPTFVSGFKWGRQDITQSGLELYQPLPIDFDTESFYSRSAILILKGTKLSSKIAP